MFPKVQWITNGDHAVDPPLTLPPSATISAPLTGKTLFLYFDESGNFDFGEKGTRYFIMTCIASKRPFNACHELMDVKYNCLESGIMIKKFHATEDTNATRKEVYSVLEKHVSRYSAYSLYVDKKSLGDGMRDPAMLYSRVFEKIIEEVFSNETLDGIEKVVAMTDDIPTAAKKRQVEKPIKTALKARALEAGVSFSLEHYPSESDFNLQIADYACWAFKRYKDGHSWPYSKISEMFAATGDAV